MDQEFFKLIANNLVSVVVAGMLLNFFIQLMKKKLLNNSETEKNIDQSLQSLDIKSKSIEDCLGKVSTVLDQISQSQAKTATLLESIDRRIDGKRKN
jgi:uncharacterized membrane-anchored protein YhcB (DUF1043 family)